MPDAVLRALSTGVLAVDLAKVEKTGRWTIERKQILLELLNRKALTIADACERYALSVEEIRSWQMREDRLGRDGLAATKLQEVGRG